MQSRVGSLVESVVNVGAGYLVAVILQIYLFPVFGIVISVSDNFIIAGIFTLVSIVRSYIMRRVFNWLIMRKYRHAKIT